MLIFFSQLIYLVLENNNIFIDLRKNRDTDRDTDTGDLHT